MSQLGVIDISRRGVFTLEQANAILPVVRKITNEYSQIVEGLIRRLESVDPKNRPITDALEAEINEHIKAWHAKIRKLGGNSKGLWLVDFDSGDGYFCWKFPEAEVMYWHSYEDGFTGRIPLNEKQRGRPLEV